MQTNRKLFVTLDAGGFGAMVARRKLAFQLASLTKREIIFVDNGYLYENPYSHELIPFSSLHQYDIKETFIANIKRTGLEQTDNTPNLFLHFDEYWNSPLSQKFQIWNTSGESYAEYSGNILDNSLHYTPEAHDYICRKLQEMNFPSCGNTDELLIGVHIRRGDKLIEDPIAPQDVRYVPMEYYHTAVEQIIERAEDSISPFARIGLFVSSDSPAAIEEFKERYNGLPQYTIIYDKNEMRLDNANWQYVSRNPHLKKLETLTAVKIIECLGNCDYVVGNSNTQFAKLGGSICCYRHHDPTRLYLIEPWTKEISHTIGTNKDNS